MTNSNPSEKNSKSRAPLLFAGGLILILLLVVTTFAGYTLGRASVTPEALSAGLDIGASTAETISTTAEVTREVTREVTIIVTATPEPAATEVESVEPHDGPAAAETALPVDAAENTNESTSVVGADAAASETDFSVFNEAWALIEEEFDGEIPEEQRRLHAAISGSLDTLDDEYTRYIRPDIAQRLRDDLDGSISGIGAFVRENDDGFVEIVRPIDGQPADLAGLLPGDIIIAVDGDTTTNSEFDEVLMTIRGPRGTTVVLTVSRLNEPDPLEFTIERTIFEVPVVYSELLEEDGNKFAYIHLTSFTRSAEESVLQSLDELLPENPQGIIFDLRDNGGGFLDQAVAVADIFLPQGIVLYERSSTGIDKVFESDDGDRAEQIPMVVLVNSGSASASEIVAGAIQDRERAVLIGETTFGKGSVQLVHQLSDDSELRVTIARWYTPNDLSISEEGILPDIEVPTPADLRGEDDGQIRRAIEYLLEGE